MKITNFREAFMEELRDLYHAENQLIKALPKMVRAAADEDLKEGFDNHFQETQGHVKRLEQVFELLGEKAKGKKCEAMEGLVEEGKEAIDADTEEASIRDSMLICAAQKVEHYEISAYGTLKAWAEAMGENEVVKLLDETLNEEKAADEKLSEAGEKLNEVNAELAGDEEDEEEEGEEVEAEEMAAGSATRKR